MAVGYDLESGAQISIWIDAVDFAGFDQRRHARPRVTTLIMTGEEGIFAVQGDRADGVFGWICAHLDASIGQKDLQPVPVAMDIAKLLAKAGFGGDAAALLRQP